ncbi:MAG: LysM peptidoglycan-binding domain-containing protein [Gammaproteobacteria bacterium]|nr:LysM peptidoglycan-binding domain-containing protein [Gammaproteobacteria bacterium]
MLIIILEKVGKTLIYKTSKTKSYPGIWLFCGLLAGTVVTGCATTGPAASAIDTTEAIQPNTHIVGSLSEDITTDEFAINPEDYQNEYTNVWDRLRDGMQMDDPDNHPRLQAELDWYVSHADYMARVIDRAEPFMHYILNELEARNLPAELALLPIVESAFQPFAYSHGRAAGIWQFIPSTGKLYGLKQNWWYDGRRDVYASTQSALRYLDNLNREFNDWSHALAAYNAGSGNVRKAIKRNRAQNKEIDFWNLDLPKETQAYVPKLMALKRIVSDPERYGISLRCLPDIPQFERVDTGSQLDIALAAELAGLNIEELYRLNPGFNRWATDPDGPHYLLVPVDNAEPFRQQLAELEPQDRMQWQRHQIRQGETLSQIADRYAVSMDNLKTINKLRTNHSIRAGQYLMIPVASRKLSDYRLSAEQRKLSLQNTQRSGTKITHTVQAGDTFWSLSRRYNVGTQEIAQWNGMASRDTLVAGQNLVIWSKARTATPTTTPRARVDITGETIRTISYKVRHGDSLYRIAQKFNVAVNDLKRWNTIGNKILRPGTVLKLHVDITDQITEG